MILHGEKEKRCLNRVRQSAFWKDGKVIVNPVDKKNFQDASDEAFQKNQIWYINPDFYKCCFGLEEEDRIEIIEILRNARTNEIASNFPDFVFDYGFIEHFQISSSKLSRKGAAHTKKMMEFKAGIQKDIEKTIAECNEYLQIQNASDKYWAISNPEHTYEFLKGSFKAHWKKHIRSLEAYSGNKDCGIFMIEYTDRALEMFENIYSDWKNGMSQGDMRAPERILDYRLSRDKAMLEYIYGYRNQIKYVVFVYSSGVEVIRVENIPYITNPLPWQYTVKDKNVKHIVSNKMIIKNT